MSDSTRQSALKLSKIKSDHVKRYQFAASRMARGIKIIDVACGIGYGSRIMFDSGLIVTGVDIHQEAIFLAQQFYSGPEYICADATKETFGNFDGMVSFETIEHLAEPDKLLQCAEVKYLLVSVPNEDVNHFSSEKFSGDEYPHLRHYTPEELEELLDKNGFKPIEKWCQSDNAGAMKPGTDGASILYICKKLLGK